MAALFQRTALPQPGIIGGAVSTRRQLKGLRAEADVAASIAKYVNKTHGGKGKVSQRTAIAIHKFAGLWGELTKRKIQVQQQLEALANTFTVTSLTQSRAGPPAAVDVVMAFNEQAMTAIPNVTVTITA